MNGNSKAWPIGPSLAPAFQLQEDDFSIRLTLSADPKFWWRVERPIDGHTLLITDFSAGDQTDATMSDALALLLSAQNVLPDQVIFHDLVPQDLASGEYRIQLTRMAQSVHNWCAAACSKLGCDLTETDLSDHRGKARYTIAFR